MADYVAQTDSQLDPDAPLTSELAYGWRDNLIAVTEGAVGAPRVQDAALSTTATSAGKDWIAIRSILFMPDDVGSVSMMSHQAVTAATYAPGDTTAGSNLRYTSGSVVSPTSGSGVWRCFGYCQTDNTGTYPLADPIRKTLWMRIS